MGGKRSVDHEILTFQKMGIRRVRATILLPKVIGCFAVGVFAGVIVLAAALLFPIYHDVQIASIVAGGIFVLGILYEGYQLPSKQKITLLLDQQGLKERLTTSLELKGKEDPLSVLQKQSTVSIIRSFDLKEAFSFQISTKRLLLVIGSISLFVVLPFLPSASKEEAITRHHLEQAKEEELQRVEAIEEQLEELAKVEAIAPEEFEKYQELLEQAKKEMNTSLEKKELSRAVERLQTKLEKENASDAVAKELEKQLSTAATDGLSESELAQMKALLEAFSAMQDNSQMAQALEQAQNSLQSGQLSAEQIQQLQQALQESTTQLASTGEAQATQGNQSSQSGQEGQSGQSGKEGQSDQSGQTGQSGQSGQTGQTGQGGQTGQTGQGGQAGSGYNYGSANGIEKVNDTPATSELVTIAGREMGNGESLSGSNTGEGESQYMGNVNGLGFTGNMVDYGSVISQYTNQAYSRIQNNQVPDRMKEIVKAYFDGLGQ